MSFDLYVQRFQAGEVASFPRNWLDDAFDSHAVDRATSGLIVLTYSDGGGGDLYVDDGEIHSFTISRPGGTLLFDRLFGLMQRAGLVVYWPSSEPSLTVADPSIIAHLPPDMVEALGPVTVVSSGADISAAIKRS